MTAELPILIFGFMIGFYMSWNIGANDVANSMASAVGAKAITLRQAIFIAGILNIVGATFIGSHVTNTIRKGIIAPEVLNDPHMALIGALAALLSAALWVSFATWKSLPVSTTHSIVGAMVGFGIVAGGFSVVNWCKLGAVVLKRSEAYQAALNWSPFFIGLAIFTSAMSFLFKTPLGKSVQMSTLTAMAISTVMALVIGFACKYLIKNRLEKNQDNGAEQIFRRIQIGTSCYVALAQGANDVANAIGPLAVIYFIVKTGSVGATVPVPLFLLLFGGVGIALGIAMGGSRVIRTVGERITTLSNSRGFAVDFSAATTVLVASKMGLPVSTTHAAIGGVMGVGMARGIEAVNFGIIFKIMVYWVLTVPVAALTCMVLFHLFEFII